MKRRTTEFESIVAGKGELPFAKKRMPCLAEMNAYLIGPAGNRLDFNNAELFFCAQDPVTRYRAAKHPFAPELFVNRVAEFPLFRW